MVRAFILLLLLVVGSPTSASAQFDARLKTGARIRASTSQLVAIGKVASIERDTIVVDRGRGVTESPLRLALNDITALEVNRPGKGAHTSGMVFGTLGFVGGGALYISWCVRNVELCSYLEPDEPDDPYDEEEDEPLPLIATVSLGFAVIGYAIGHALVPPRWEIVDLPLRIGIAPMPRGVGVYVSLPAPRFVRDRTARANRSAAPGASVR
jgi:hypothetical protein